MSIMPKLPSLSGAVLALLIAAGTILLPKGNAQAADRPLDLAEFELTFEENFDTLSVSAWGEKPTRWIAHTPWNGDFGAAHFSDPAEGFPFTTDKGGLRIEARKGEDGNWRAGLLSSANPRGEGFSQKFGYFEARMKLPPGKGVWPAFWLIGLDRSRFTAEIDVMEYYGRAPYEFSSGYHIWRESHGGKNQNDGYWTAVPQGSLSTDFHTWGVEIRADRTTIYFDRKPVWGFDTPPEFHMPFFPLVNLALGAGWPIDETPNPSYLFVDYIHVYKRKDAGVTE